MLVLARRPGEGVTIVTPSGETIKVFICDIDRGKVRIGFGASKDILIHRDEVVAKIKEAKAAEKFGEGPAHAV